MKKALELKNVSFKYKENSEYILENLSLSIYEGQWVSLLGHNGSGKSTISKIMAGLTNPNKGEVLIFGKEYNEENIFDIRKMISVVFQNPDSQFVGATVEDDIAFGLENHFFKPEEMKDIITEVLTKVNMNDFIEAAPHKLSGGQKQKVAIAGVIAISPKIIIFDESTSMLDPKGVREVNKLIKKIHKEQKITIINITHNMEETLWSDRLVIIEKGKIKFDDAPEEIVFNIDKLRSLNLDAPFIAKVSQELFAQEICDKKTIDEEEILSCLK